MTVDEEYQEAREIVRKDRNSKFFLFLYALGMMFFNTWCAWFTGGGWAWFFRAFILFWAVDAYKKGSMFFELKGLLKNAPTHKDPSRESP